MDARAICAIRAELDLSPADLACMLGVDEGDVVGWEGGTSQPTPYNVQQLSMLCLGLPILTLEERRAVRSLIVWGQGASALSVVVSRALDHQARDHGLVGVA